MNRSYQRGVSLAEIVLSCLISAGVLSLLVLAYVKARHCARETQCINNLRRLGQLIFLYCDKYGGFPPPDDKTFLNALRNTPSLAESVAGENHKLFVCPCTGLEPSPKALQYRYPPTSRSRKFDSQTSPDEVIAADMVPNHPRGNINALLFDGTVITFYLAVEEEERSYWRKQRARASAASPDILVQEVPQDGR